MTQRAVVSQVCGVCGLRLTSKDEMTVHTEEFHGVNWAPGMMRRSKDQMEFHPHLMQTPWGSDFKEASLNRRRS